MRNDVYEFAFSYPFTYTFLQYELGFMDFMGGSHMRRQVLCRTPQQRKVEAITISSPLMPCPLEGPGVSDGSACLLAPMTRLLSSNTNSIQIGGLRRKSSGEGKGRPVVFITARAHPGETPASFVCQGLLSFLVSSDPRAVLLRSNICFVLVPTCNTITWS